MNPFVKKLIDSKFMTEAQGSYIEEAVMKKDSIFISGHKGFGILPLFATISALAKGSFKIKQVKTYEDLKDEADYYLVGDLSNIDYGKLVTDAVLKKDTSFIALKDPDHPYSVLKVLGDAYKQNGDTSKTYQLIECVKVDGVPQLSKITKITLNENGKLVKTDL